MLISVNKATLTGCDPGEYEQMYQDAGDYMAALPGHVDQILTRSTTSPGVYIAVAAWASLEDYTALAGMQDLVDIFERVVSLSGPGAEQDKIALEHQKADVVYGEQTAPPEAGGPGSMVCLNRIKLTGCTPERYEEVYRQGSDFMAALPGHLRHRLVKSRFEDDLYFSVAEWETLEHYRKIDGITELEDIFDQINDKVEIENHECVVVYANRVPGPASGAAS